MNKQTFIKLLENPNLMDISQAKEIRNIIDDFPYFQSARVIYLKALKDLESFKYNNELKKTASYTTDRTILFDFITSKPFIEEKKSANEKKFEQNINIKKNEDNNILSDEKNVPKTEKQAEELLEIGKPLNFNKNEQYSFNKWLQLTNNQKPIIRKQKTKQEEIIDKFISISPKISKIDKSKSFEIKPQPEPEYKQLMTETLAKIYLEQKKFDSAIKAYEILSLKYPEKSGFFADRIKQIQILQKSK